MASDLPGQTDDDLIARPEVARIYDVADATVSAWMMRGDPRLPPPAVRRKNYTRWRRGDVTERVRAISSANVVVMRGRKAT